MNLSRNNLTSGTAIASQAKGHRATGTEMPAEASQMATQGRHHASTGSSPLSHTATENLAHLLRCLDRAVECMEQCGFDCDSQFVEAHRAQLARGREWYGDPIATVRCSDGSTIHDDGAEIGRSA